MVLNGGGVEYSRKRIPTLFAGVSEKNLNYLLEASVQFPPLYRWASADHQERPKECINQKFKEDIPISLKHENSKNAEKNCCNPLALLPSQSPTAEFAVKTPLFYCLRGPIPSRRVPKIRGEKGVPAQVWSSSRMRVEITRSITKSPRVASKSNAFKNQRKSNSE
ncbi:hypothetical protein TNCV_2246411 [Trichonephila clavipes]|nr:hypothetical protein TNCV_2246411 [Trichonephila clavipes]